MSEKQRRRFAKTISRLVEEARTSQGAPISGNVGEDCMGYITDPAGRLYRLNKYKKTEIDIGPGVYNIDRSLFQGKHGITIGIIPKKKEKEKTPGFYDTSLKSTKIYHKLPSRDLTPNPFARQYRRTDYSIPVKTAEKERRSHPERLHPSAHPFNSQCTHQFASKTQRDAFNLKHVEASKSADSQRVPYIEPDDSEQMTAVFKSKTDRVCFDLKPSGIPDPTAYTLPDTFGRCNGVSFQECFPEGEKVPKEITPAPGQYEVDPVIVKATKRIKPKDFTTSYPRNMKVPEPIMPGPCEFQDYTHPLENTRPSTIFSKNIPEKDKWVRQSFSPDPCHYNVNETFITP